jgi:hypothetical protein
MSLTDLAGRVEFAFRLAKRLLMFPLTPQPGDTWEDHAKALETSYALEITNALNERERSGPCE